MGGCGSKLTEVEKLAVFCRSPLFVAGTETELAELARVAKTREVRGGVLLVPDKVPCDTFFVIGSGEVELLTHEVSGDRQKEITLCVKRAGDFFCDQALFDENFVPNSFVRAAAPCSLVTVTRKAFEQFLVRHEEIQGPGSGTELRSRLAGVTSTAMTMYLSKIRWLRGLTDWQLQLLGSVFQYQTISRGEVVFRQGDVGNSMFVVLHGAVSVLVAQDGTAGDGVAGSTNRPSTSTPASRRPSSKHAEAGASSLPASSSQPSQLQSRLPGVVAGISETDITSAGVELSSRVEKEVAVLREGQYFGEIALMVNLPRTASVVAAEDCLLISIGKENFFNFLHVVPDVRGRFELATKQRIAEQFKAFKVPFFSSIPDRLYGELAGLCEYEEFSAGETIFNEGDSGRKFYIVVHGNVAVYARDAEGEEVCIDGKGPGRYFGEIALLKDVQRTATVRTTTRCVLLSIEQARFTSFFDSHPEAFGDFEIKLARRGVSLDAVLRHDLARDYLRSHLAKEYATENLDFWLAAQQFSRMSVPSTSMPVEVEPGEDPAVPEEATEEMKTEARRLLEQYINEDAPHEINVPAAVKTELQQIVASGRFTPQLFQTAANEVFSMMSRDTFKRFTAGPLFEEFLERIDAYRSDEVRSGSSFQVQHASTGVPSVSDDCLAGHE